MITEPPARWDRVTDVVVVGSGAAGLAAAVRAHDGGAEVLVLEKADLIGGTTGVSGGMPWVPLNRHMADLGVEDSRDEALAYLRRVTLGREPDPELLEAYVDTAADALEHLETKTPLRMSAPPGFSDYFADQPGGKPGGRSVEPVPFDARSALGDWAPRLRTSPHLPWLTMEEGGKFLTGVDMPDIALAGRREADDVRVLGAALVAALFAGLLERGVGVETGVAARDLVVGDGGAVVGVRVAGGSGSGPDRLVGARRGVVLACGGFEWNRSMVRAFIGHEVEPMSPPGNEGDGHRMAMEVGARLANMTSFWGQPAILEPGATYDGHPMFQMGTARSNPGSILVNKLGRRFANEGVAYQELPKVFATYDPVAIDFPNEAPVWIVFDQRVKDTMVVLPTVLPGQPAPDWILRAGTVGELAGLIDVDPGTLEDTVARYNELADRGEDEDFGRGTAWFEGFMTGGPRPSRCLAPLRTPPYYAVQLHNGTLGTSGGPLTDRDGRVRRWDGGVIDGLYAAGNAAANVFGPAYPGGGATIGPALVFGSLAGRHAAGRQPFSPPKMSS
jgi:succinate dehydrogenase/fumarate reductase flavoprotein subunit